MHPEILTPNRTLSIAVMSGKGGVGKTNISLNLGYGLHRGGSPLLIMDCDLGLANLDVLLGLSPERTLQDLLRPGMNGRQIVLDIEKTGFHFLPAASGVPELVSMDEDMQSLLFRKLTELVHDYDYLLLDLGAGISQTVLSFATMVQVRIVIVTPEPTSLTDSYALMKVLHTRYGLDDFYIVVNQAANAAEAKRTFERLSAACQKFLGITIRLLGSVGNDPTMTEAVRRQVPLMKLNPHSDAAKDILETAAKLKRLRESNLELIAQSPPLKNFPAVGLD